MTVYIDKSVLAEPEAVQAEEGLAACELVALGADGNAALRGAEWSLGEYSGPLMDADGSELSREDLRLALLKEKAGAVWQELEDAGYLKGITASMSMLARLLDALEGVPLLRAVIRKLREG